MIEFHTHQPGHWQPAHASGPWVQGVTRFGDIPEVLMDAQCFP